MPSPRVKIILIDDDPEMSHLLLNSLSSQDYQINVAVIGITALHMLASDNYDLVLLATSLPELDGFEVLKRIRKKYLTPVIMLSPNDDEFERILGLELGADDYLAKSLSSRELIAHIRARLRHEHYSTRSSLLPILLVGNLRIETQLRKATYNEQAFPLTDAEFAIVELLALNHGQIVSKKEISNKAFNRPLLDFDRSIDMHMSNLRKKFLRFQENSGIRTIRNRGYMLVQQ